MKTFGSVDFNVPGLRAGRSVLSPILRVPAGCMRFDVVIDGSAWPEESKVKLGIQVKYGDKFKEPGKIVETCRKELVNNRCSVGLFFEEPTTEELIVRGAIRVLSGPSVDIIGSVICA